MSLLSLLHNNRLFDLDIEHFKLGGDLSVDLYEADGNLVAEMTIPGVSAEHIDISIEGHHLRVSGSRKEKEEKKGKDFYSKEIRTGSFERHVYLPCVVVAEKTTADYKEGVLKITMPKKVAPESNKVKVAVK